jgi:glutamate-ammonia-ligase adenylyltransferase
VPLYAPVQRDQQAAELRAEIEAVAGADLEQQMEVLRHFKQSQVLTVAAADVMGLLPVATVSDHLSDVAEVILEQVLALAWDHAVRRHGRPSYVEGGRRREAGFAIVAYGKLGGRELGYGSDVDLVFLHDSAGEDQVTDGSTPIDNALFFSRLAKRIIHILTIHTPSGVLYEVDTRLRPDGGAGLLVSSLEAFEAYQRGQAWTWEHQALTRARPVAGSESVIGRFKAIRERALGQPRDVQALRSQVCGMRDRMRRSRASRQAGFFDLKQDPGGIVDIEFIAQFGVLSWAKAEPELVHFTATLPLLAEFERRGFMSREDSERLARAYRAYRARLHALTLQEEPARVAEEEFAESCAAVVAIWRRLLSCEDGDEGRA